MAKKITRIGDLIPDKRNANLGTERGQGMLESSLRNYGAGRSVLVDRDGNIIAGNKTVETAASIGLDDVVVVQTDGKKLVVVQRTDLDLTKHKAARELATIDNRVGQIDLNWDSDELLRMKDEGFDLATLGFYDSEILPANFKEHWTGMPEYEQDDLRAEKTLLVHFTSTKHVAAFAKLLNQTITSETKSIWYPKAKSGRNSGKRYVGRKDQ